MEFLLPVVSAMLGAACCAIGFLIRQRRPRNAGASIDANAGGNEALAQELAMLTSTSVGMGQRLDRLAAELRALGERVEAVEAREPAAAGSYMHAIRMAERGKGVDELMEVFGVSRAEAELLRKLHPEQKSAHH